MTSTIEFEHDFPSRRTAPTRSTSTSGGWPVAPGRW